TLLAKQCWRIHQSPGLLLSRVLKSVYFPFGSIPTTSSRARPSWGWQSILHGRKLLLQGLRWQVGSGHLVDPCFDNWLPSPNKFRPQLALPVQYHGPPTVAGFIRQGTWNGPLLPFWFTEESSDQFWPFHFLFLPFKIVSSGTSPRLGIILHLLDLV
ncbi:hypothetical protein LINPERHAP1_LOCUS7640, partial [Linum perenne]